MNKRIIDEDKENQFSNSPKKFKRLFSQENLILSTNSANKETNETQQIKQNNLLEQSEKDLNKFDFELNNGDYVIYEYCNELTRQIQQAKEEKILKLEDLSEQFISQIETFKKEATNNYLQKDKKEMIQKMESLKNSFKNLNDNESIQRFKQKLSVDSIILNKFTFNDNYLKFEQKKDQNIFGNLYYKTNTVINAETDLLLDSNLIVPDLFLNNLSKKVYYRYFNNGESVLAFGKEAEDNLVLIVLNQDKTVKAAKIFQPLSADNHNIFYVENDKIVYQSKDHSVRVLDSDLKQINKFRNNEKLRLLGASESYLYFGSNQLFYRIIVYTWHFIYIRKMGKIQGPFCFETDADEKCVSYLRDYKENYYFLDLDSVIIMNMRSGERIKSFGRNVEHFLKDSDGNFILFTSGFLDRNNQSIEYYDSEGNFKKKFKLKDFTKNDDNDDDDYDDEWEDLIDAFTVDSNNRICFFDRNKLMFYYTY